MAEQIIEKNEDPTPSNIAAGLDSELDAALNKSFAHLREQNNQPDTKKNDLPVEPAKKEEASIQEPAQKNVTIQLKQEPKAERPVEKEKPVLSSEEVDRLDPKEKGAWGAIKNANKRAHSIIEQKESEISKLKSTLAEKTSASQKELEAIRAEKADLEKYRAMVDIQADPEFVSKYDKPLEVAHKVVYEMLKAQGVTDENMALINFNDTETLDKMVSIVNQKDRFKASKLERAFKEIVELNDKRHDTLLEHQKNYKETLEKKKQEGFAKGAESEGRMIKHLELKASEKGKDGNPLIPFLSRVEPKEGATQAEIDQVSNHNNLVDVMTKKLQGVLKMKEPEQQAEIAIAAVASHYLMTQLNIERYESKRLREELSKIAAVTTEAPSRKPASTQRNGNNEAIDHDTALHNFFGRSR